MKLLVLIGFTLIAVNSQALELFKPVLVDCSHVDRTIHMAALQDFQVFVDGIEMSELISKKKTDTISGTALTSIGGSSSLVPAEIKRKKDDILELKIAFGDGMGSFTLSGEIDFNSDEITEVFDYVHRSSTKHLKVGYMYKCKLGFR